MGLFSRRPRVSRTVDREAYRADLEHLEGFVRTRYGVEAFIEPRTTVTSTTVMLIAHDGEWTRRRVVDPYAARQFGNRLGIPVYDVHLVGYPQRMRDYNERRKRAAAAERAAGPERTGSVERVAGAERAAGTERAAVADGAQIPKSAP